MCLFIPMLFSILRNRRHISLLILTKFNPLQPGVAFLYLLKTLGSNGLKFQWKTKKNIWILLKLLAKWLTYKLRRFWMVFIFYLFFFWFCLTLSVPEKRKNSIFEMPMITQTLNINNLRITSVKSIKMHTIKKLIEYSLKNVIVKAMFTLTVFEILLFEGRSVLPPSQRGHCTKNEVFH